MLVRSWRRPMTVAVALLALAVLIAGCGGGGSSAPAASSQAARPSSSQPAQPAASGGSGASLEPVVVSMKNFRFTPDEIVVRTGQKVVFKNDDLIQHNVVQTTVDKGLTGPYGFESPRIDAGQSWEYTFNTPGEYPILCNVDAHHLAGMVATVKVQE